MRRLLDTAYAVQAEDTLAAELRKLTRSVLWKASSASRPPTEDDEQQVLLELYRRLPSYDASRGLFSTWAYMVVKQTISKLRSAIQPEQWPLSEAEAQLSDDEYISSIIGNIDLEKLLVSFGDDIAAILRDRLDGLTWREIAAKHGLQMSAAAKRFERAMAKWRRRRA